MQRLILASSSPRRKILLEQLGVQFEIVTSSISEKVDKNLIPEEVAKSLAYQKAYDVASKMNSGLILGLDTIVVIDNNILGKPKDSSDIYNMLEQLSGKVHQVITGVCLINATDKSFLLDSDVSYIKMRDISRDEIGQYIKSEEPFEKAGSYAIQGLGAVFVEDIKGSYSGIVGLPIFKVYKMLKHYGIDVLGGNNN